MWNALSRIFAKGTTTQELAEEEQKVQVSECVKTAPMEETIADKLAKQRASVKWLLSKAFNNRVPDNLNEPFYKDHEHQERLKPQIISALASAEIYCMALSNIYSDPNYHNMNHWSILQTLARKGVYVSEPSDAQLTETTLIQTNPLRISAHMAVIESMMVLYAKEVVTADRVLAAIRRFTYDRHDLKSTVPETSEEGLFMWISNAYDALRKRLEQESGLENGSGLANGNIGGNNGVSQNNQRKPLPNLPKLGELKDLGDGVALASLISYYCPDELPWNKINISYIPNVQQSLQNLALLQDFCLRCLPVTIFHITPEDITFMRDSMKVNLLVFLADLFNVIEIHPVKCVRYPGMENFNFDGSKISHVPPLKRTNSLQTDCFSEDSLLREQSSPSNAYDEQPQQPFVVHRGRHIPTLRSVVNNSGGSYNSTNNGSSTNYNSNNTGSGPFEGSDLKSAAGRPSNWEQNRKTTFAGRRSRRNSISDDSQLTIENFGGSQDNLNLIGRNPDKEVGVGHRSRKSSICGPPVYPVEQQQHQAAVPVRSSLQDARGSIQLGYDEDCPNTNHKYGCETDGTTTMPLLNATKFRQQSNSQQQQQQQQPQLLSSDNHHSVNNNNNNKENYHQDSTPTANSHQLLLNLSSDPISNSKPVNFMNHSNDLLLLEAAAAAANNRKPPPYSAPPPPLPVAAGAAAPTAQLVGSNNTTTWQQQCNNNSSVFAASVHPIVINDEFSSNNVVVAAAAAATPSTGPFVVSPSQLNDIRMKLEEKRRLIENEKKRIEMAMNRQRQKVGKAAFLQAVVKEINDDTNAIERKWLEDDINGQYFIETRRTPELDNMDFEQYQQSIAQMNTSLHDIRSDIQHLATQQGQIQAAQQQSIVLQQQQKQIQALQYAYNNSNNNSNAHTQQSQSTLPHMRPQQQQQQQQFFLHDKSANLNEVATPPTPPVPPPRRTWSQHLNSNYQSQQQQQLTPPPAQSVDYSKTWNKYQQNGGGGGMITTSSSSSTDSQSFVVPMAATNGSFTLSRNAGTSPLNASSSSSTNTLVVHRQISQLLDDDKCSDSGSKRALAISTASPVSLQQMELSPAMRKSNSNISNSSFMHTPIPAPSVDDMEPQIVSFIGSSEVDRLTDGLSRLNITSGNRTYRIPSPTRPHLNRTSTFQLSSSATPPSSSSCPMGPTTTTTHDNHDVDVGNEKGFYIQFDDEAPKRPKPPLRLKRQSPRKDHFPVSHHHQHNQHQHGVGAGSSSSSSPLPPLSNSSLTSSSNSEEAPTTTTNNNHREMELLAKRRQLSRELNEERVRQQQRRLQSVNNTAEQREKWRAQELEERKVAAAHSLVIGSDFHNVDPVVVDERERKKERIMMLSLQRRHEQEMAKAKKEQEAQVRREREKTKEELKARKREEQAARRVAILEQYKLKKAMDDAEREGKVFDKSELMHSLKPAAKMRSKAATYRPRPKTIHVDSGSVDVVEGVMPPSNRGKKGSTTNLAVNSSTMKRDYYRGSHDSLADRSINNSVIYRGGSSTDQDSMAYRYGDTDSGLGRATPPRRAPSPGLLVGRHLTSPSGPGSLPGFMTKARRIFDDGASDISSTPSSMMDYTGPRLYKQPTTKSNRGIILNAVEYCVFPGVVNRDAKRRVLDEINRSESKHYLILFRDAGCQFRALYSYCPDRDEIAKLYGTGPKLVNDRMFDKFFKYNSGGKCFSQVHTKHLTVTIDAFTIHNSLWQGKKVNLPNKKDMALVI